MALCVASVHGGLPGPPTCPTNTLSLSCDGPPSLRVNTEVLTPVRPQALCGGPSYQLGLQLLPSPPAPATPQTCQGHSTLPWLFPPLCPVAPSPSAFKDASTFFSKSTPWL